MTTATRRLRRAGVAGFATVATVGGLIISSGTAFAAELAVTDQPAGPALSLFPGGASQAVQDLQINVPNSFHIGDTITVTLGGGDCTTTNKGIGFANTPTAPVTGSFANAFGTPAGAGAAADTAPAVTVVPSSVGAGCSVAGVKDTLTLTFTNSSTGIATDNYVITVTGAKVTVGSAVAAATNVTETPTSGSAQTVGTVLTTKISAASTVGASTINASTAIGNVTLADVGGKVIDGSKITFTLTNGAKFVNAGKLTGPAGVTYALKSGTTLPAASVEFDATGTVPNTANTYTLSGATISTPSIGRVNLIAADATPTNIGPAGGVQVAVVADAEHIGGIDRYATAADLFEAEFTGTNTAVLASGANFPDALSANVLANSQSTGVLLTDPNVLSSATLQVLKSEDITTVYIVGGPKAVSSAIETQIDGLHAQNTTANPLINVIRVAGADRYGTNNAVNLTAFGTVQRTAIVASGASFPDALAAGAIAYGEGWPLILTDPANLSAGASSTITNLGVTDVFIVGGTAAVSANVETQLGKDVTVDYRVAGADRTQTAAQIAMWATAGLPKTTAYAAAASLGFDPNDVFMARGDNFADALAAGPVAGDNGEVILLTSSPSVLGAGVPSFFAGKAGTIDTITVPGLASAVTPATVSAAIASLQ